MEHSETRAQALSAYQGILRQHGFSRAEVAKRAHLARCILAKLSPTADPNLSYRHAVDRAIADLPPNEKESCAMVARDFFPFIINDIREIAARAKSGGYARTASHPRFPRFSTIDEFIAHSEEEKLNHYLTAIIDTYSRHLTAKGAQKLAAANRVKIARALIVLLKDMEIDGPAYREAVDHLLPFFTKPETRTYFLNVAREFYAIAFQDDTPRGTHPDSA